MDPLTALAALAPLVIDLGKSAIGKWMGGDFKPANVADWIAMQRVDIERFKAMNEAGGTNPTYLWVEAIIRLQRPLVVSVVLGVWAFKHATGTETAGADTYSTVDNLAGAVGFYLFGDRTLFYIRGKQ